MKPEPNLIYQYIRGSKAHGISTPQSDTDMGGVFVAPATQLLGLGTNYKDEIADEKHDVVYWELRKFMGLLLKSNPTALESLFVDKEFQLQVNPCMGFLFEHRDMFLTKACFNPFGHYAADQIRKARGQNKMINQPILVRKTPMDFCFVTYGNDTKPMRVWMKEFNLSEDMVSLAKLNHAKDAYAVFMYPGGFCKPNGNDVHVNNLPKGLTSVGTLFFNRDAYKVHCRDYKNQKEWETNRNPVRYESNLGKGYDSKNMSECLRLVHTCTEIARGETYHVNRKGIDADLLLKIRAHEFEFEPLMEICDAAVQEMNDAVAKSTIPESLNPDLVDTLTYDLRQMVYMAKIYVPVC